MRRVALLIVCLVLAASAGCGTRSTAWSDAVKLRNEGEWGQAIREFTGIIENSDNERAVAGAYLYRGDCRMQAGELEAAYRDLLAGKLMSCWFTSQKSGYTGAVVGYLAMSEACQTFAPRRLAELRRSLSPEQIRRARAGARRLVPEKYCTP
jgi:hypothetical protein